MEDYQYRVQEFAKYLSNSGKLPSTVESYCRDAFGFSQYLKAYGTVYSQVAPETLVSYKDHLSFEKNESINSVRRTMIGIRQFFRFLAASNALSTSPFDQVPLPGRIEELPGQLEFVDFDKIIQACHQRTPVYRALRDAAIVSLLAFEGIKATELIALNWVDAIFNNQSGSIRIGGPRARSIVLSQETSAILGSYRDSLIASNLTDLAPSAESAMFVSFKGKESSTIIPRITRHGLKFVLYEIGEGAGIPHLNTELLRHHAMESLIARGLGTSELMQHLGLRTVGNIAKHTTNAEK